MKVKSIFFFVMFSLVTVLPHLALAQSSGGGLTSLIPCTASKGEPGDLPKEAGPSGLNCNSWQDLVETVQFFINYALIIATLLATISFMYAGWLYLTSGANPGQRQRAHGIFLSVIKGFLFMAVAYLLVKTILSGIAKSSYSLLE